MAQILFHAYKTGITKDVCSDIQTTVHCTLSTYVLQTSMNCGLYTY